MNRIPQILGFETKNVIINNILSKLKEKLLAFFTNCFLDFSKNRYTTFMLNLQKLFFEEIRNIIVEFIETIDKIYRESSERKKNLYINSKSDPRTIYTIFGEITFTRTYYKYKDENKYYYFIDDVLGFENMIHMILLLKLLLLMMRLITIQIMLVAILH